MRDLTLEIEPGEIVGLLGPNGAGKSSTMRAICALEKPTRGTIHVAGINVAQQAITSKQEIGYVAEDAAVIEEFSARDQLRFMAELRSLDVAEAVAYGVQLLVKLGLSEAAMNTPMVSFSKGQRQRVAIACAMMHGPSLLLLDEPLNGLDVEATAKLKQLLYDFAEAGGAVLCCSHLVDVMERFVPRVVIIREGERIADAPTKELTGSTQSGTLAEAFSHATLNHDVYMEGVQE